MSEDSGEIQYRLVTRVEEVLQVVELQKTAWPDHMLTNLPQIASAIRHGGCVVGAFAGEKLVGFNYGFTGFKNGETYLASHKTAVDPDYRDHGIGMRLKTEQRLWALEYGYRKIVWTFDPFETRNGNLNLCKLGGIVRTYVRAVYGNDAQGLPTDRFLIEWNLESERVQNALAGRREAEYSASYPSLLNYTVRDAKIVSVQIETPDDAPGYLLAVPANIRQLKQENLPLVAQWQSTLRDVCTSLFERGYQVTALNRRDGLHHDYVLEKSL